MLAGKTIIITGASSGLGRALALDLARLKANPVLFARKQEKLLQTQQLCSQFNSPPIIFSGDVTKPEDCQKLVNLTVDRFGALDILVANAGIGLWAKFEEIKDLSVMSKIMETNYLGAVNCTHYALPHLKKSKGLITVISSIQGKQAVPFHTGYSASKHALHGFFDSLRIELAESGVDVLIAQPSWIKGTAWRENTLGKNGGPVKESRRQHGNEALSVEECARVIVDAMAKRKREVVIPAKLKFLPWLNAVNPGIVDFFIKMKVRGQS
ncbi:MAG: SDR family oxidoreductase [bacterium]